MDLCRKFSKCGYFFADWKLRETGLQLLSPRGQQGSNHLAQRGGHHLAKKKALNLAELRNYEKQGSPDESLF